MITMIFLRIIYLKKIFQKHLSTHPQDNRSIYSAQYVSIIQVIQTIADFLSMT